MTANTFRVLAAALFALLLGAGAANAQESTWERVMNTKTLRVSAIAGEAPYYSKDRATGEWSGIFIDMMKDIAAGLNVKLEIVEASSWGGAILDLRSGKTDLHVGVNPTPQRGMVLDYSDPVYLNAFNTICRPGVEAKTWDELNKPDMRIAIDIGSSHEAIAKRFAPNAKITGFKSRDEVILAIASKKADCMVMTPLLGLSAIKKNPGIGKLTIPTPVAFTVSPIVQNKQPDKRMIEFANVWIAYNKGLGQIREWILGNLKAIGVDRSDVPPEVQF